MNNYLSPVAMHVCKEALFVIYWYKKDLRNFFYGCIDDKSILANIDWNNYKKQIVSDVIDALYSDSRRYSKDITRLLNEICKIRSFGHLEQLEDGKRKAIEAAKAVEALRQILKDHNERSKEAEESKRKRQARMAIIQSNQAMLERLNLIKDTYFKLFSSDKPQNRGFALEKIMYDTFLLFDLDPKASFKNMGEQIDGAFTLEGTDYLFEAKWQKPPADGVDLDSFIGKINRKLDNTLGLFLSINGFSDDAVKIHSAGRSTTLLMDGLDLTAVLEGRIDFTSLIIRKRRHAAQTGEIYLKFNYEL
jgi:hypothetical protein